jgi:hypothetical protein
LHAQAAKLEEDNLSLHTELEEVGFENGLTRAVMFSNMQKYQDCFEIISLEAVSNIPLSLFG